MSFSDPKEGARLGPYELVSRLGAGGGGEVWKARDTRLDRFVAIKFSQEQYSIRFAREARAVAALNHPNICQIYDVGPNYLIMEYVEGGPIAPVESIRKLLELAVQIAGGMAAAHAAGITHRDLKPANILVTPDSRVKILDFGLARMATVPSQTASTQTMGHTDPGTILGTVSYMSPEQARGHPPADARSDQFTFGLILYELLAAKNPFERESAVETMTAIIREDAASLPGSVPAPLRWVIERCMAKDPSERYESTLDLHHELRRLLQHLSEIAPASHIPVEGPAEAPPTAAIVPAKSGGPMRVAAAAAAGLLAGIALTLYWPLSPPEPPRLTPFATEEEFQSMPRWSPAGDRIAFVANVNGLLQIFLKKPGSSTLTQLTHENQSCFQPLWSADGKRVYYRQGSGGASTLWSVSTSGGSSEKVMERVTRADLSPDGKTLAVIAVLEGRLQLAFSSPPGAKPVPYTQASLNDPASLQGATWLQYHPSGKYLGLYSGGRGQLWKIPVDGGAPQELLHGRFGGWSDFAWLMGGSRVVGHALSGASGYDLALFDLSSGVLRTLSAGANVRDSAPSVSPDGRSLAYATGDVGFDIVEVPLDGSPIRDRIATARDEVAPSWVPDGHAFVYSSDRNNSEEIWLRDLDDGTERLIAGPKDFAAPTVLPMLDCEVSPDGRRVAYVRSPQSGPVAIWISPISGESPEPIWEDPAGLPQRGPSWSPDGNFIAYYGVREGKSLMFKARLGSEQPPEIVTEVSQSPVRWSPRGDWIAFRLGRELRIVSPDAKQNRTISSQVWETYGWAKDGSALYGIRFDDQRRRILARIDLPGKETKVADFGPVPPAFDFADFFNLQSYRGFSMNPDGKSFLTSVFRAKAQIYLMEDFDRPLRLADQLFGRR